MGYGYTLAGVTAIIEACPAACGVECSASCVNSLTFVAQPLLLVKKGLAGRGERRGDEEGGREGEGGRGREREIEREREREP